MPLPRIEVPLAQNVLKATIGHIYLITDPI